MPVELCFAYIQSGMHQQVFHVMHHVMQLAMYLLGQRHFRKNEFVVIKRTNILIFAYKEKRMEALYQVTKLAKPDGIFQNHKISRIGSLLHTVPRSGNHRTTRSLYLLTTKKILHYA